MGSRSMNPNRRQVLGLSARATVFAVTGLRSAAAHATEGEAKAAIAGFARGKTPVAGRIKLTVPQTAENGNMVALTVAVESAMSGDDIVDTVIVLADSNPNVAVAQFYFSEFSGAAAATTRIRLARSQNVIAVARMRDGSTFIDSRYVSVTVGGCGG